MAPAASSSRDPRAGASSSSSELRDLVERSRRELARMHHPDVGGNNEVMQGINCLPIHLLGRNGRGR